MFPLLLPLATNIIGSIFHPRTTVAPTLPGSSSSTQFSSYLNQVLGGQNHLPAQGTLSGQNMMQWSPQQTQRTLQNLMGSQVTATSINGQTYSGAVDGMQNYGNTFALSIGGHLLPLNQINQLNWSTTSSPTTNL